MKESTRNLAILIAWVFIVTPWVLQTQYASASLDTFGTKELDVNTELQTWYGYYNTTGAYQSIQLTETILSNGSFTVTLAATGQDLDKPAYLFLQLEETSIWNFTAWDQDTTGCISAFDLQVSTDTEDKPLLLSLGAANPYGDRKALITDSAMTTHDTLYQRSFMSLAMYNIVDDYQLAWVSEHVYITIEEADACEFINAQVVTLGLHFYSGENLIVFNQYLLIFGCANGFIAFGMTKMYDLTPGGRRNS